jgi:hypothetical protein
MLCLFHSDSPESSEISHQPGYVPSGFPQTTNDQGNRPEIPACGFRSHERVRPSDKRTLLWDNFIGQAAPWSLTIAGIFATDFQLGPF